MKTDRLRIAVLVKRFITTGGVERYAVEVTQRLVEKGHAIDLYARTADEGSLRGMTLHQVPDNFKFLTVLNSLSFARETARMLHGKDYDVIHSHERGYRQDILTIHTLSYKGGTKTYSPLRKIDRVYLSPRSALHLWLERKQMRTRRLVAVSRTIEEDIRENYGRTGGVSIISPGIDTALFSPQWVAENRDKIREEEVLPSDEMVVLFVGSEFRRKGLDHLIPAIGPGMRLLVVGSGERKDHYRNLVKKHDLTDRVYFTGHTDNVRRYFAAADVVVLPSLSEAFGMSILEGMACGHPIVTSSNAGVSSFVKNGVNGFVFDDPFELSGILNRLMNPAERKRLGDRARATAEEHGWQNVADEYEKLYFEVAQPTT
jgi:UDP-glucose:(heptosyl)LPS alpha-1,3-glucosyltransferase